MSTGSALFFLELFVVFVCLGTIPGAVAWMLLVKDSSRIEVLTFGSIFGLVLMAFGGALSFWTQNYSLRYLPAALVVIIGFIKKDFFLMKIYAVKATNSKVLIGALLGFALISAQLLVTLSTQPTNWSGWWTFYVDLPFHAALTSEFLNRAPLTFPWFPGTQLNYTWMIHSALGVWGSNLNVPSDFLVLQAWPVLFAILLPIAIAVLASKFIANGYASLIAPAATMLFIGPIGLQGTGFKYYPTISTSPTHEFGQLLLIATVLILHQRRPTNELKDKVLQTYSLVLLLTFFIVTVGSKGVMPLLIVSVMVTYWAYHYFSRSLHLDHFLVTGISVLGVLVSLKFVINSTGGIGLSLFHLLEGDSDYFVVRSILAIFLLLVWLFSAGTILMRFVPKSRGLVLIALVPSIISIGATFSLSHGGKSQAYFYLSIVPLLVILVVSAIETLAFKINHLLVLTAFFVTYATYWLMKIFPVSESTRTSLFLLTFFPIAITLFVVAFGFKSLTTQGRQSRVLTILLLTSLSSFCAQPFSISTDPWSNQSSIEDPTSIQIELVSDMRLLKEFSSSYDMVVTNRLCNFPRDSCGSRDWFLSEYSERRVYFETHAYSYTNDLGPHEERVQIVDKFMQNPSPDIVLRLWDSGVRWIFIDKTRPFVTYSKVATLKYDSSVSQIWEIQVP